MAATRGEADRPKLVLGVYVITAAGLARGRGHAEVAIGAIEGGANAVQLRAPEHRDADLLGLATELADRCRERGVLFLVADRIELALECGAAGVHLGRGGLWPKARARLGPDPVLGVTVADPEQARAAEEAGADYLGVTVLRGAAVTAGPGAAAGTGTAAGPAGAGGATGGPDPAAFEEGLRRLRSIVAVTRLPVVGSGGIDAGNARQVLDAGTAGIAVRSAVAAAPDPAAATRELVAAVRGTRGGPPFLPGAGREG